MLIAGAAAFADTTTFVQQQYGDFLGRAPSGQELNDGENAINGGEASSDFVVGLFNSSEFATHGRFVAQAYRGLLLRIPDEQGYRACWNALQAGISQTDLVDSFITSSEFQSRFGSNLTNQQFVVLLYQNVLLRQPQNGEEQPSVQALDEGKMTRAQVALSFLESSEFNHIAESQNEVDVALLYLDMLQRVPDSGGFAAYVQFLDNGNSLSAAIGSVLDSTEYAARQINWFLATPIGVTPGAAVTLSWRTTNTISVSISGVGSVAASGSTTVHPNAWTAYTITTTGSNGVSQSFPLFVSTVASAPQPPPGCSANQSAPSITICTPANGSTASSPVHITAAPNSSNGVAAIAVYVDNTLAYKQNVQTLDTNIAMANGSHYVVVQFWDNSGNVPAKASVNITVSGTSTAPTATLSANPTTISSGGNSTLTWSTTNASSVSIDQGIGTVAASGSLNVSPTTTTTYTLTATGSGGTASATATVTLGTGGGGTCTAGAAPSITICTPTNGSTVTSPVHITAAPASNNGVAAIAVYVDNTLAYKQNVQTLDTDIAMSNGSHYVVVQYWDNSGKVPAKASVNITVSGSGGGSSGTVDVLTMHNDQSRDGANTNETVLTPSNVNTSQFGKIVGYGVDGQVYAQPLVVSNLNIAGGTHDVLYVATEHDSVYAFDADNQTGTPYWSLSLLAPGQSPASSSDAEGISPQIGVTGTPVIDRGNNTLYLVEMAYVSGAGNQFFLHALDLSTGHEKFGGPVRINPSISGTGYGNVNGKLSLEGGCYERVGLALANGIVYTTFGHCSHGWVIGYNENTLQLAGVYNSSPNGKGASIWMGGGAPPVDSSGNLYFETGVDADSTTSSGYSDSFIKLSPGLTQLDYFQVSNNSYLTTNDADLGSGAPMILPDNSSSFPHEVIGAGKDGRIFLVNRDNMGQFDPNANHVVQVVQSGTQQFDNFFDQPAYWNGYVYYHAENDVLRQFSWSNGLLSTSPVYKGAITFGTHGATPSVSANGTSNGIVWELQVDGQPSNPAVLHAYNANDVSNELWNSSMKSGDAAGPAVKFTVPTIANGKVYVPAGNQVDIYGLK